MKSTMLVLSSIWLMLACKEPVKQNDWIDKNLIQAENQLTHAVNLLPDSSGYPRSIHPDGRLSLVKASDWTSGFFPGSLWYMYEYTGKESWKYQAQRWTASIETQKTRKNTHDLGFMFYCSFGNGYRLASDPAYREVLLEAARSLASRYHPKVKAIRSWDFAKDKWQFPVIIDNMMNLELLFWASRASGDQAFREMAIQHAQTTMANHFRADYSSFHVVDYDPLTGQVRKQETHQGYSDASAWARGQAWGLYGFTLCYRETNDPRFLAQAEKIAAFLLSHPNLPADKVPYWDFDAPGIPNEPRDASAAALIASALLELSIYSSTKSDTYRQNARVILQSLASSAYQATVGTNNGFILMHSTGSKPDGSEVDKPLNYADYYYLEALLRIRKMEK